jgi:hypothetical protein
MGSYGWTEQDWQRHLEKFKPSLPSRSPVVSPTALARPEGAARHDLVTLAPSVGDSGHSYRPRKYRSQPTAVNGILFDSKKEAGRYSELRLLESVGAIRDLKLQPRFDLIACNGEIVGHFTPDFQYWSLELVCLVVEDVKSEATKTTAYRLRKRLFEASHGLTLSEI